MRDLRPEVQAFIDRVSAFIDAEIKPNEATYAQQVEEGGRWCVPPIMEEMKVKAKAEGLWNFFLPGYEGEFGTGLSNFEYSHLAEKMGTTGIASEVFNCSAPDTGNMEVLERYGSEEQKETWLKPLLAGEIRSAFGMTEPGVASSDATNMAATAVLEGDEYVINGEKWWTSGAGDPRCKIIIFMCVTDQDPDSPRHKRHSQILVPMDSEGIEVRKMLEVFGWDVSVAGHIKYGENFINAVIRESKEETGIKIQKEKLKKVGVFYTEEFYTNVTDREFHHTYIYKISSDEIDLDFNNNEVEELQFISLNNMKDLLQNNSEFFIEIGRASCRERV